MELRSITGHESQKNFEGYIRIGISEQALRVGGNNENMHENQLFLCKNTGKKLDFVLFFEK